MLQKDLFTTKNAYAIDRQEYQAVNKNHKHCRENEAQLSPSFVF